MTIADIEEVLKGKGDFVQIDYLSRLLKIKFLPLGRKKFVCLKLAEIYEKKGMLKDAAKMYSNVAIICVAYSEKIKNYMKEAELYVKAGAFDLVDEAIKKAMNHSNSAEKENIYFTIKDFYKRQALVYEKEMKRAQAVRIYEKLLEMNINEAERQVIKDRLMPLYEKLGKLKEYFKLKKS